MDITTYANQLRQEVTAATQLGGPDLASAAERVLLALDPAIRLVLMEALSDAAAEISSELPVGSVETRLRGRDLGFVIEGMDAEHAEPDSVGPDTTAGEEPDSGDQVRITLRLPESLKTRSEELATERGQSLNSWLVDAVRAATRPGPPAPPVPPLLDLRGGRGRGPSRRMTGWA